MFGFKVFREKAKLDLIWIALFLFFGFSIGCLPSLLPESLHFIASIIAGLSWIGMGFVLVAGWGIGPLAKHLNKAAIEEDEKYRSKFSAAKQPWE